MVAKTNSSFLWQVVCCNDSHDLLWETELRKSFMLDRHVRVLLSWWMVCTDTTAQPSARWVSHFCVSLIPPSATEKKQQGSELLHPFCPPQTHFSPRTDELWYNRSRLGASKIWGEQIRFLWYSVNSNHTGIMFLNKQYKDEFSL